VVLALLQDDDDRTESTSGTGQAARSIMVDAVDLASLDPPRDLQSSVTTLSTNGTVWPISSVGTVWPLVSQDTTGGVTTVTISTDVLFEFGSAEVSEGGRTAIVEAVRSVPDGTSINVTGYTDSEGGDEINLPVPGPVRPT
jgi:outer membrane protein OmpA-like peptidoglycan-associated protein